MKIFLVLMLLGGVCYADTELELRYSKFEYYKEYITRPDFESSGADYGNDYSFSISRKINEDLKVKFSYDMLYSRSKASSGEGVTNSTSLSIVYKL